MSLIHELGSLHSSLDDLARRLSTAADQLAGSDDATYAGLLEVERHLRSASRRLERVIRGLP
jgi:hypothetical protein